MRRRHASASVGVVGFERETAAGDGSWGPLALALALVVGTSNGFALSSVGFGAPLVVVGGVRRDSASTARFQSRKDWSMLHNAPTTLSWGERDSSARRTSSSTRRGTSPWCTARPQRRDTPAPHAPSAPHASGCASRSAASCLRGRWWPRGSAHRGRHSRCDPIVVQHGCLYVYSMRVRTSLERFPRGRAPLRAQVDTASVPHRAHRPP